MVVAGVHGAGGAGGRDGRSLPLAPLPTRLHDGATGTATRRPSLPRGAGPGRRGEERATGCDGRDV